MMITATELDTKYADWFREKWKTGQAKREILQRFSTEPDDAYQWMNQDLYEQCHIIIRYWNNQPNSPTGSLVSVSCRVGVSVFTRTLHSHRLSPALRAAVAVEKSRRVGLHSILRCGSPFRFGWLSSGVKVALFLRASGSQKTFFTL